MTTYYIDDAGSATAPYDTWAKAATSINQLDTAVVFGSGDIVYFGHDMQCQATNSANLTITDNGGAIPVRFISATTGSSPPAYQIATGNQIDTTEGAYSITFSNNFALYGMRVVSGANITFTTDVNYSEDTTFALGANGQLILSGESRNKNMTVDLTADGTTNRANAVFSVSDNLHQSINGLSFVNAAYRTGTVFSGNTGGPVVSGADFSGFTNATACELVGLGTNQRICLINSKTAATWTPFSGAARCDNTLVNCGSADQPVALYHKTLLGEIVASSAIYRSSGAEIESTATAWLITTIAQTSVDSPYKTPWIYGTISATGSKTFDLYVTNDTADLNDDEIWLEVEYKADASSGKWTLITDKPTNRTTTPVAQTDDVTSTWNGTGPSFTYKQKLSVTATVNTTGQFRARVCVGKASVASSSYLYVDPLVTVS